MKLVLTFANGGFIVTWCSSRERIGGCETSCLVCSRVTQALSNSKGDRVAIGSYSSDG
jgi:hypothetical protein